MAYAMALFFCLHLSFVVLDSDKGINKEKAMFYSVVLAVRCGLDEGGFRLWKQWLVVNAGSREEAARDLHLEIDGSDFYVPGTKTRVFLDEMPVATSDQLISIAGQLEAEVAEALRRHSESLGPLGIRAVDADARGPS